MSSILSSSISVGKETTFGTAATLARSYEAQADTFKRSQEYMQSVGMRGGFHTARSDRQVQTNLGGEGSISVDFLTEGMGYILQACLGTAGEAVEDTTAYKQTYATSDVETGDSYTVQVKRADIGGTLRPFTYLGSTIYAWKLQQSVQDFLKAEFQFTASDTSEAVGAATEAYVDSGIFHWEHCTLTWGGSQIDVMDFELSGDLGLKTDRRFLRGDPAVKQPLRASLPEFTGNFNGEFEDMSLYNDFKAGTVDELVATWDYGSVVSGSTTNYSLTVTCPAVQLMGDTPETSLGDTPKQSVPFKVLHNGTDPAITMEYVTVDDALIT